MGSRSGSNAGRCSGPKLTEAAGHLLGTDSVPASCSPLRRHPIGASCSIRAKVKLVFAGGREQTIDTERYRNRLHVVCTYANWVQYTRAIGRHVRFHDLRHTCASALVSGVWGRAWSLQEVCAFLGHSSISVTERYAHFAGTALETAAKETEIALFNRTPNARIILQSKSRRLKYVK